MNRKKLLRWTLVVAMIECLSASSADAQVIQLPSFHTFSYSGSVLVPDSGSASLGGVRRSVSNRSGRNFTGASSHAGAAVHVTIIDHQAIDRAILGQSRFDDQKSADSQNSLSHKDATAEGKSLVRHARSMYRSGNAAAARMSYQMAIQLLDGRLKQLAKSEYERVLPSPH
ncbi:hypothetical protein [Rubripirellula reticaptiva]|uniref:Uncharacterized protein n=1 Tax=Rubripirellula reticaptiva TaxID=2528013 RepID=A0A5C6EJL1_9BACT|nr:hypothetical protein [Rubripirellula reticaptiva]TWU47821.1 hypothetical protein Poly59_46630 [Rubripirellula reticaptiva]